MWTYTTRYTLNTENASKNELFKAINEPTIQYNNNHHTTYNQTCRSRNRTISDLYLHRTTIHQIQIENCVHLYTYTHWTLNTYNNHTTIHYTLTSFNYSNEIAIIHYSFDALTNGTNVDVVPGKETARTCVCKGHCRYITDLHVFKMW